MQIPGGFSIVDQKISSFWLGQQYKSWVHKMKRAKYLALADNSQGIFHVLLKTAQFLEAHPDQAFSPPPPTTKAKISSLIKKKKKKESTQI